MIEIVTGAVYVGNVLDVYIFVVVTVLFQLLAKQNSATLSCEQLLTSTCKHLNDSSFIIHHNHIVSFAIIYLFSLLNTRAKTNHRWYKVRSTFHE